MKLILYHFDSCPYCVRVRDVIDDLQVPDVEYRNIFENLDYKEELIQLNGHRQVPCMVIDGKPMLESEDIVEWLEENFAS